MFCYYSSFLIFLSSFTFAIGQEMHLVISQIGKGASYVQENGISEPIQRASFISFDSRIMVHLQSGMETMAAGYQFRFGSETQFNLSDKSIHLHNGSLMIQSRKIGNNVVVMSPRVQLRIGGVGTCMLEVEPNDLPWINPNKHEEKWEILMNKLRLVVGRIEYASKEKTRTVH